MARYINYKETLSKKANPNPIRCKTTSETIYKLRNDIKANAKYIRSNIGGWSHGHFSLMLTNEKYMITSPTAFVYLTHPGTLITLEGTTSHTNSNMRIAHTEKMCLFWEVMRFEQDLVQQIFATFEEAHITDICKQMTKSINNTMEDMLTHLQDKYSKLTPHKLLEREDISKKTTYHPKDPKETVFSAVEELLKFSDISETSYTQLQAMNIAYVIIHRTGKFGLAII